VSRLEQFAACPFRYFVHSGLRAEERKVFELDRREQGSFQHEALALFHDALRRKNKQWRDLTPQEARQRMGHACASLLAEDYRDGLFQATEQSRFLARVLTQSLQDFIEILVTWMRQQYLFNPVRVELPFGHQSRDRFPRQSPAEAGEGAALKQEAVSTDLPPWTIELEPGSTFPRLELSGRIDRVDLYLDADRGQAFCVVVDYKSSQKKLDALLMANGLQLQLLAYLGVLRRCLNPLEFFGARKLIPTGVFYVNLRGQYESEKNRRDALNGIADARKLAYQHTGRFNLDGLSLLDSRPDAVKGDQFKYGRNKDRQINRKSADPMPGADFEALLDSVEANLRRMGRKIFLGQAKVDPYRKGSTIACAQCGYQSICRIDPWTHSYRTLEAPEPKQG
jgi:ATP-dependent helicase/nuclease subunit B